MFKIELEIGQKIIEEQYHLSRQMASQQHVGMDFPELHFTFV